MKKQILALMLATSMLLTACGTGSDSNKTVEVDPHLGEGMTDSQKEKNDKDILNKLMTAIEGAVTDTGFNQTFEIKIENGETKVICSGSSADQNTALTDKIAEKLGTSGDELYNETAGKLVMDTTKGKGITVNTMFSDAGKPTIMVFCSGNKKVQATNMAGLSAVQ